MEKMTESEILEVVQAYMDGKELEFQANSGSWYPVSEPIWDFTKERYRIKRQPRVIWVNERSDGEVYGYYKTANEARRGSYDDTRQVKFIEVLDD